jgi:hypothetical protein
MYLVPRAFDYNAPFSNDPLDGSKRCNTGDYLHFRKDKNKSEHKVISSEYVTTLTLSL